LGEIAAAGNHLVRLLSQVIRHQLSVLTNFSLP
jgi:hypothetical protein